MSFSTASPAGVSVVVDIVNDALLVDWASSSERLSRPTLLSNGSLLESEEDNLVILGTRAV